MLKRFKVTLYTPKSALFFLMFFGAILHGRAQCAFSLGNDTTLCSAASLLLDAGNGADSYLWQDGSTGQTYVASGPGQYYCTASYNQTNAIVNPDFEQGNTGFTTGYPNYGGGAIGSIVIGTNPNAYNGLHSGSDHTSGAGNFLIADGATNGAYVWCQTVNVTPNTNYMFSGWVNNVVVPTSAFSDPDIALYINNIQITNTGPIPETPDDWIYVSGTWNSGANTTADLCIGSLSNNGSGNDFGLDDLYFGIQCTHTDTINITQLPSPSLDLGLDTSLCATDSLLLDAQNPGASYNWNTGAFSQTIYASASGTYAVEVIAPNGCNTTDTIIISTAPAAVANLGGDIITCSNSALLDATAPNSTYLWSDGSGNATLSVTADGTYWVTVTNNSGCSASDTVQVTFTSALTLDLGNDTLLCGNGALILDAGPGFDVYQWQDGSTNQTLYITASGTYHCTAGVQGNNILYNGDFEAGDTGFTTSYSLGTGGAWGLLSNAGTYAVAANPNNVHTNFAFCGDHTTGAGQMMIVNGSTNPNTNVWCQTVSVQPNTDYNFSTWVISAVNGTNVAQLQFSINGNNLGSIFSPSPTACVWDQFNTVWNSGANTTATLCVVNQNTAGGGNDFALDDIFFAPICSASDTINVVIEPNPVVNLGQDQTICVGDSLLLDAQNPGLSYQWSTSATQQTIYASTTGTYDVTVTSPNGCASNDAMTLTVVPYPVVNLGNDTVICPGTTLLLDAGNANASHLWNDNSTLQTLSVTDSGLYFVEVDNNFCSSWDTIQVGLHTIAVDLGNDTTVCAGETIVLDPALSNVTFFWSDGSGGNTYQTGSAGQHWLQITDTNTCTAADTMVLTVTPLPVIDLGPDVSFCADENHTFSANNPGQTYLWNDGTTGNSLTTDTAGIYWVEATEQGCTMIDSVAATVIPLPVFDLGPDVALCENQAVLLDPGITGDTYQWNVGTDIPTHQVLNQPGIYILTITNDNCVFSDTVTVTYTWFPQVALPADTTICSGDEIVVMADTAYQTQITWHNNASDAFVEVEDNEVVTVEVQNQCGTASDTMVVSTTLCDCFMYLPNTFTPNNDAKNDLFGVEYTCDLMDFRLEIFNRWGELIWSTDEPTLFWDGTYRGMSVQDGVYVWKLSYSSMNRNVLEEFVKTGHVNVLR